MKSLYCLFITLFALSNVLLAQTIISGTVIDEKTKEPLQGINVYLSETTIGEATDENGFFSFETFQTGSFKLVASSIGYFSKYVNINIQPGKRINREFQLKEKVIELDEIVVSTDNKDWKKKLELFQDFFIGNAEFSENTYFQNPEVLRFEGPNKYRDIRVITEAPLIIKNDGLGYTIEAEFIEVIFNLNTNTGIYKLTTRFSEMKPPSKNKLEQWEENRFDIYHGSPTHFYRSLIKKRHKKEKFDIVSKGARIERVKDSDLHKLSRFYPQSWGALLDTYSVFALTFEPVIVGYKLRYDQLDKVINDYALSYISYSGDNPYILIDDNGGLFDPSVIQLSGKWGLERISVMLPLDYESEK